MPININFLVHTKSASFDYQWIYGIEDKKLESDLNQLVLNWLSNKELDSLSRASTFFQFKDYFALMTASASSTRRDAEKRVIFQRAIFLWKPDEIMLYGHLAPLLGILESHADKIYAEVPDNELRIEQKQHRFTIYLSDLDKWLRTNQSLFQAWKLPTGLKWAHILREKWSVEVPSSWEFAAMISPIWDAKISENNPIFIGQGLHRRNRFDSDRSWILSSTEPSGAGASELKILDRYGSEVPASQYPSSSTRRTLSSGSLARSGGESQTRNPGGVSGDPITDGYDNAPPYGHHRPSEAEDAEQGVRDEARLAVYSAVSERGRSLADQEEKSSWLKKKKQAESKLQSILAQINLLIIPLEYNVPLELTIAWQHLLLEIALFSQSASASWREEWMRRIRRLEDLMPRERTRESQVLLKQLNNGCYSLIELLQEPDK
jgi:hypothetical protein